MNNKVKLIIGTAAFIVFMAIIYFFYTYLSGRYGSSAQVSGTGKSASSTVKNAAPDFTVYDAKGNKVKLSDFKGKPVVLNFWASWCTYCKKEMPDFNEVYADAGKDVTFLMVDAVDGQYETQSSGQAYVDAQKYSFPVYFDNDGQASEAYGISGIPETVFIDADGYIVTVHAGLMDKAALLAGIKQIQK